MDRSLKLALGSLLVSLIVLAVKYAAFLWTGSVALYSDALESIVNVVTATAAFIAIRIAAQPPDAEHPYGHQKAEYLSAVVVGALIIASALAILHEAYLGFKTPSPIRTPWTGLAISSGATLVNIGWSLILTRQGRIQRSAALVADGRHLMADVVTSVGVLCGVALVVITGVVVMDAIIAVLVATHVLWSGWGVLRDSTSGLMDEAAPGADLARIREVISITAGEALEAHDLRTRHAGKTTFIDFHLVVPGDMNVAQAHDICDRVEVGLKNELEGAIVTIHVEPEHKAKAKGIRVV